MIHAEGALRERIEAARITLREGSHSITIAMAKLGALLDSGRPLSDLVDEMQDLGVTDLCRMMVMATTEAIAYEEALRLLTRDI